MSTTKDAPDISLSFVEICNPRLWMSASYKNTYVGNSAPAAVLDVSAPLADWYDMGNIKAVRIPVTKDVFDYKQGIPKTSRKMWEIDRTAQITFNTAELTPYVEAFMMGQSIYNTLSGNAYWVSSTYVSARTTAKLASSVDFAVDDLVVCASPTNASLAKSYNLSVVESLTASVLVVEDAGFPISTVEKDNIQKVTRVAFIDKMGADVVRSIMLFWDTNVDSSGNIQLQHVLYYPKVRNFAGGELDFKDSAEPYDTAVTLTSQAVNMTYDDSTTGYNFYKKWVLAY